MTRWESNMVQVARGYLLAKAPDAALDVLEAILKSEKMALAGAGVPWDDLGGVGPSVRVFPPAVERPANATGPLRSLSIPDSAMWEEPTP